jgi:predicted O-methyltransferase YrrM
MLKRYVRRSRLRSVGFHGDRHLLELVDRLQSVTGSFVETGTNVGSTARYMARKYPTKRVLTCEPDEAAFRIASANLATLSNVELHKRTSLEFLETIHTVHGDLASGLNLYFLDAHGVYVTEKRELRVHWPLREEVVFVTSRVPRAVILVDDAQVPGRREFQYMEFGTEICGVEYVMNAIARRGSYQLTYPAYSNGSSERDIGYLVLSYGDGEAARILSESVFHDTTRVIV